MGEKVIQEGRVSGAVIHDEPGVLRGFLISHAEATTQTVTFYDNDTAATGTVLLVVKVAPERSPCYILFPRNDAIPFDTGLAAVYTNCELNVWSVGFAS